MRTQNREDIWTIKWKYLIFDINVDIIQNVAKNSRLDYTK